MLEALRRLETRTKGVVGGRSADCTRQRKGEQDMYRALNRQIMYIYMFNYVSIIHLYI